MEDYELRGNFREAIWSLIDDECIEHPADAFEQALDLVFDLAEEEEIEELIQRVKRNG